MIKIISEIDNYPNMQPLEIVNRGIALEGDALYMFKQKVEERLRHEMAERIAEIIEDNF